MNFYGRASEDGPNDSLAMAIFSGIFGIVGAGAVAVGVATVFNNSTKPPDPIPPPPVIVPACTEGDRADVAVVEMPINVTNADISNVVCFVRVAVGSDDSRIEIRYR